MACTSCKNCCALRKHRKFYIAFCCALLSGACARSAYAGAHIPITWQENKEESKEHVRVKGVRSKIDVPMQESGVKANYLNKEATLGPLGKVNLAKAPFSVMQTSHDVIENQQLRQMDQATEYMPSVQLVALTDPGLTRTVNRGFESDTVNNSRIDGLNVLSITPYTSEQFSGLTILNGAAGAMYGPENPAGVLEMTQKRPTARPFFNFNFGYDSSGSPLESLDTSIGKGPVKLRFNYMNQTGQSYAPTSNQWRDFYGGDIDIQLAKHTKLELDASQYNTGFYGYPGYFAYSDDVPLPSAPDLSKGGYGQPFTGSNLSTSLGQAKLFHEFSPNLRLKLGGSYENSARYDFPTANTILSDSACAAKGITGPCYTQKSAVPANGQNFGIWSNYAYLNGDFHTGLIQHHWNLGSNGYSVQNDAPTIVHSVSIDGNNARPFYDPTVVQGIQPRKYGNFENSLTQQQALILGDNMDIGRFVSVMGEMSWGWIRTQNWKNPVTGKGNNGVSQTNGAYSPSVTLTLHPTSNFNAYFNWGTSVQAGPTVPPGSYGSGDVLPAIQSQQYEGGIKYTWRKRLQVNLDGFVMSRPYAYTDQNLLTNGQQTYGLFGLQTDSGVEFQVSGAVSRDLSVLGGVTWLDPIVTGTHNAATDNKQVVGVAPWVADFLLDWHPHYLHGISFNSNIRYEGKRAANLENTDWASQYVTLDLGVRYSIKICDHQIVFRGTVDNVTGEDYWASVFSKSSAGSPGSGETAAAGIPRTWHITSSIYF
ncbi:TonB-dependent siderophore receptor [Acetobacteraceae bacterium]|nr:TonB-dependent siderophore receptor [Acetobacteraceae bacterium]